MKTKVCSIPKVKVQQNRFNLHEILVLRGSKVEKAIFLHFCIKKNKDISCDLWRYEAKWLPPLTFSGRQFYGDSKCT